MKIKKIKTLTEARKILARGGKLCCEAAKIPTISCINEFKEICRKNNFSVEPKKVAKQGKIITAEIAEKDQKIKSREGMETAHKGDLIVDDGDNTYYAVPAENITKFYEVDKNGKSMTGDQTKWKKKSMTLDYYITPFDVNVKVSWQNDPLFASKGYALVANDREGKSISPVAPKIFADKTMWKLLP